MASLILISFTDTVGLAEETGLSKAGSYYLKEYKFSTDWFTAKIPFWKKTLADFKGRPDISYLEIGVFEGNSAIWVLENILTHPTSKMTCIDTFPEDLHERFLANLELSGAKEKATVIKGPSQIELRYLPLNSFDIVYIDGSHIAKDVLTDGVLSWGLLKKGGIMIFDDYRWKEDTLPAELRPQMAIDAFIKSFKDELEMISHSYQVIVKKTIRAE